MSGFVSVLLAILMLGVMIGIHEAGHFFAARLCGIQVRAFALGFGPKLIGWTGKKTGTEFALRLLPLGGYCAFYGEDDTKGEEQDDPRAFPKQKLGARMITVLMGPIMNFVLAFAVLLGVYLCAPVQELQGEAVYLPTIQQVEAGSVAESAGILAGDIVVSINGQDVLEGFDPTDLTASVFNQVISAWQEGDEPLRIVLKRRSDEGTQLIETEASPVWDESYGRYRIGLTWTGALRTVADDGTVLVTERGRTLGEALSDTWSDCVYAATTILRALKALVTTGEGLDQTGGPVAVVSTVSEMTREYGMQQYFWMMCVISINLGIMNLLPIPGLDGSRFLFMVLEAIRRKPVPQKWEATIHAVGTLVLLALMLFITFRDVINLFH